MAGVLLALAASLAWGAADFSGGLLTRRWPVIAVALVSQAAGFAGFLVVVAVAGLKLDGEGVAIGMVGGVAGAAGLVAFYRALSIGTVSIVAPVASCGAIVPLVLALAGGDDPRALALVGAVVALTGALMASAEERAAEESARRDAMALAALAAVMIGLFVFFLGRASQHGGAISGLVGARTASLPLLAIWALAARTPVRFPRHTLPAVAAVGLLDLAANTLFAYASRHGLLAIISVLGSLYPVPTVVLAHLVLGERISVFQRAGVAVALLGVATVAATG